MCASHETGIDETDRCIIVVSPVRVFVFNYVWLGYYCMDFGYRPWRDERKVMGIDSKRDWVWQPCISLTVQSIQSASTSGYTTCSFQNRPFCNCIRCRSAWCVVCCRLYRKLIRLRKITIFHRWYWTLLIGLNVGIGWKTLMD